MKATRRLRSKVDPMLRSRPVQVAAERVLRVLDRVEEAADRAKVVKAVQRMLKERGAETLVTRPLESVRRELGRVAHPLHGAAADKPMPEVIRAKGGKRIPAPVANRAVRRADDDFKPKKGKKH